MKKIKLPQLRYANYLLEYKITLAGSSLMIIRGAKHCLEYFFSTAPLGDFAAFNIVYHLK